MQRFIIIFFLALSVLLALSFNAHATVRISYFYDGDTVKILDDTNEYRLRITNIDAPERNQPHGKKSRRALMQLCEAAEITVKITGTDKYQRKLGKLYCDEKNVAEFMLKNGHAWFNDRYSTDLVLALKERSAREKKTWLMEW